MADPATGQVDTAKTLIVRDGKVERIAAGFISNADGEVLDLRDRFVLPGLIDAHVHLTNSTRPGGRGFMSTAEQAMSGIKKARLMLDQGFTTVADLNGDADAIFALRDAIRSGIVSGPRVLAAGNSIAPHGGHGDVHGQPWEVVLAMRSPSVCSGPDDCSRAVREMVMRGADLVKVSVTGGVLSNTDASLMQQFSEEEIRAIVASAHRVGRKVTAHAHGADGINAFLKAGGDSIEHGTFIDAEGVRIMNKLQRYLVPTLLVGDVITREALAADSEYSPAQKAKALAVGPKLIDAARRAHEGGVRIAFGTDVVGDSPENANAREFILLEKAGLTPLEAIQAATVNAADHLGISASAGSLKPGLPADLIAVDGNPLNDLGVLQNIRLVMKDGAVVRH